MSSYADTFQRVLQSDYDDATPEERTEAVKELIEMGSAAAAAAAIQPFPFLDVVLLSPIQIGLVQAIGRVHGHRLDQKSILEILSTFGASVLAQNIIVSSAKLVPFAGWIAAPAMAYALTWAVGEVSEHYFKNGRGVESDELREMFKKTYRSKKAEKVAEHRGDGQKGDGSLEDRLAQLREALDAGILTQDEYDQKKADILRDF